MLNSAEHETTVAILTSMSQINVTLSKTENESSIDSGYFNIYGCSDGLNMKNALYPWDHLMEKLTEMPP